MRMDTKSKIDEKLQKIIEIERELGEIQDVDVLLERILTETRRIVNADAGSIYVVEGNKLKIPKVKKIKKLDLWGLINGKK